VQKGLTGEKRIQIKIKIVDNSAYKIFYIMGKDKNIMK